MRARDAGFEVVYQGIRLTPAQIVAAAVEEDVDLVGLSVLSGSHLAAVPAVLDGLRAAGRADLPVVVGGIIPAGDAETLRAGRRGPGLHAEGLRAHRDHRRAGHRRAGGQRAAAQVSAVASAHRAISPPTTSRPAAPVSRRLSSRRPTQAAATGMPVNGAAR